jgi:hypothetical protein
MVAVTLLRAGAAIVGGAGAQESASWSNCFPISIGIWPAARTRDPLAIARLPGESDPLVARGLLLVHKSRWAEPCASSSPSALSGWLCWSTTPALKLYLSVL